MFPKPLLHAADRLRAEIDGHPIRFVAVLGALVTLAMVNLRLFLAPGPWWRGWVDQQQYLESARAFLALDLDPARHWYPLAYPLTAAPFAGFLAAPFVPINIACFALAFAGFRRVAARFDVGALGAVLLFLAATLLDPRIMRLWIEPWTTTLSAAAIWMALGMAADRLFGEDLPPRRAALLGALLMLIPLVRPADLPVSAIVALFVLWRMQLRAVAAMAGAGMGVLAAYGALYLGIYGARWSDYVMLSREYGFNFADLPWKAYVLLVDPSAWFAGETGLLRQMPWLLFGMSGMLLGGFALRGRGRALWFCLVAVAIAYTAMLFAYVDLLPSGVWRFNNIHYFKWLMPFFALAAWLFVRWAREMPRTACGTVIALMLLPCIRPEPVPVAANEPARSVRFATAPASWTDVYMARSAIADAAGVQRNFFEYHQIPAKGGMMAVSLKHPFTGGERWLSELRATAWPRNWRNNAALVTDLSPRLIARLGTRWRFGLPAWLPGASAQTLAE